LLNAVIRHCIEELQVRFLPTQDNFFIKKVDADGIGIISKGLLKE